ncbi:MAG: protein kinase [Deltaproteobacteria bacterium]|nr:protein kinase [Deltaproteobacteria bacterium]
MARFPEPGTVLLGKYRVNSLIGEGGMGVVIRAKHIELDEDVAIKCLLPEMLERPDIVQRFLREAKAAVKLKGEHVARVHDVGRLENQIPFIVMEYLEGADLNAILKHHGAQEPAIATDLMLQACEAIAEAHSLGIVHRDIKSSNFFITQPDNEAPILKVLDFGIATAPEGTSDLTSTQSVIGTPSYMSPEMMRSSKTSDSRSDIWSLGVVLYELLEGDRPFRSEAYSELCLKVGMDPPIPITNPRVGEGLRAVVMKCLEKPLEKRYQSVAELAYDLMPFASDPNTARKSVEQCARFLGRRTMRTIDGSRPGTGERTPNQRTPTSSQLAETVLADASDVESRGGAGPLTPGSRSTGGTPSLLGRPTPAPSTQPTTHTSIGGSSGQFAQPLSPESRPRRRGILIAMTSASLIAIGIIAMLAVGGGSEDSESPEPLGSEAASSPITLEPVTPEPAKLVEPAKVEPANVEPANVEPANVEPAKEPAQVADPIVVAEPAKVAEVKTTTTPPPIKKVSTQKVSTQKVVKKDPVKKDPVKKDSVKKDPVKKDPVKDAKDEPGGELFKKRE